MATITPRASGRWQARIRRGGTCISETFATKADAEAWARLQESSIERGLWRDTTEAERTPLADALARYRDEITPRKRGRAQETSVLSLLLDDPIARITLARTRSSDVASMIARWRRAGYASGTINRRLNILSHVFETAIRAWGLPINNPVRRTIRPRPPRGRDRRLLPGEEDRLLAACKAYGGPIGLIVAFALETAMRRGEIASMRWEHIDREARVLLVPETKTGEPRRVPLASRALAILDGQIRRIDGYVWGVRANSITQAFARVVKAARNDYEAECCTASAHPDPRMLRDLRFHDLRHEATSRLFERGLNPMEVSTITGHKTLQMLKRYTHLRAEDLVDRLG